MSSSRFILHPLLDPYSCAGYPSGWMRNKPENEVHFMVSSIKKKSLNKNCFQIWRRRSNDHTPGNDISELACSLITRGDCDLNDPISSTDLTKKLVSKKRKINTTKPVIIICHGFASWRNQMLLSNLAVDLSNAMDMHVLRFDFTGNGHSKGEWKYANYDQDFKDLLSVVNFVENGLDCSIHCIIGHSQGSASVLKYSSVCSKKEPPPCKYFVNLAGRYSVQNDFDPSRTFKPDKCIDLKQQGYFTMTQRGEKEDRIRKVTQEQIDMRNRHDVSSTIEMLQSNENVNILTIHGDSDNIVPIENAYRFDKEIGNHKLYIVKNADHNFNGLKYHDELVTAIAGFCLKKN